MNRQPVSSSNVRSMGWEPGEEDPRHGTLEVEFHSGGIYQYENIPESLYEELLGASSIGRALNQDVIGSYDEHRVR